MKISKRTRIIFFVLFVAIGAVTRCDCDDESMEVPSELDIFGTWILKSADFKEDVDLDGDGPMIPRRDIQYFILELLNVYASCSSIDEMPIQFSDELVSEPTSADPTIRYKIYAVCPEGMGVTSKIGAYYMDPYRVNAFYLEIDNLNDPANLLRWEGQLFMTISEDLTVDGVRTLHGYSALLLNSSSGYKQFEFVLEEYTGE